MKLCVCVCERSSDSFCYNGTFCPHSKNMMLAQDLQGVRQVKIHTEMRGHPLPNGVALKERKVVVQRNGRPKCNQKTASRSQVTLRFSDVLRLSPDSDPRPPKKKLTKPIFCLSQGKTDYSISGVLEISLTRIGGGKSKPERGREKYKLSKNHLLDDRFPTRRLLTQGPLE